MKLILLVYILLLSFSVQARGLRSQNNIGGLKNEDPFQNFNKGGSNASLRDQVETRRRLEELGYGPMKNGNKDNSKKRKSDIIY